MSDALLAYATQRRASGRLRMILLARHINHTLGGGIVGPWDLAALDEPTLDAFEMMLTDLPQMQAGMDRIEAAKARIISGHPTYRKH